MDLSIPSPTSNAAGARGVVAQVQLPDLPTRLARFDELSATVLDTSGKSGEDQQLAAYQALHSMSATGQLIGIEDDRRKVLDQVTGESDVARRAQPLSKAYYQAVSAAARSEDGASGALKAALNTFDGLSTSDQKVLFATTLNAADRTGAPPFADAQAWRENTSAQLKMVDYMQSAGVVGADGRLDHRAAAAKSGDAKFAEALKLSLRRDNTSADWTRSVHQLFGADRAADKVELSAAARKLVSEQPATATSSTPAAPPETTYRAGSIVSRSV
jgi:hypothetical protein